MSCLQTPGPGKIGKAAVISLLGFGRKTTAWKLLRSQVIAYTFAAHAFFITVIRAFAALFVLLFLAFHDWQYLLDL